MKKSTIVKIALTAAFAATCVNLTSCFLFSKPSAPVTEVSTLNQLKAAYGGKIVLKNDIDCQYTSLNSISADEFDGNGYTIKNCYITETDGSRSTSFFNKGVKTIKNVKFENIEVSGKNGLSAAIVCTGDSNKIENVHVENCKITYTQASHGNNLTKTARKCYIGGIYAGFESSLNNGYPTEYFDCQITNCSVTALTIELNGCAATNAAQAKMYAGGIAGGCNNIKNCAAKDLKITAISTGIFNYPYIGGIVAYSEGSIEKCEATGNRLLAKAPYYSASGAGYASSDVYNGGIVAYVKSSGNIKYCHADDNHFYSTSSGSIYSGGIAGYADGTSISQSYSYHNYFTADGYVQKANGNLATQRAKRRIGGLIGTSKNNAVTSCFSYNSDTMAEQNSDLLNEPSESKIAGLIAETDKNTTVIYSAAYSKLITSPVKDAFITTDTNVKNCYCNDKFGNANNCTVIEESFWTTHEDIKDKLNLTGNYWLYEKDKLPVFTFGD